MKILFAKTNYARKKQYLIQTTIYEVDGQLFVKKRAYSETSKPHLASLVSSSDLILDNLSTISIASILKVESDAITFEYIHANSIEKQIESTFFYQEYDKQTQLLNSLLTIKSSFKQTFTSPYLNNNFINIFDPKKQFYTQKKIECCAIAPIDLNFDNILLENNKIHIIDYEWTFNFPIPFEYIIFRAIYTLSEKLQDIIQLHCQEKYPCYEVAENFFIPQIWYDQFHFSRIDLHKNVFYELNLQNFINLHTESNTRSFFSTPRLRNSHIESNTRILLQNLKTNSQWHQISTLPQKYSDTKNALENVTKLFKKNAELQNNITQVRNDIQHLEHELHVIKKGKIFKIWQFYCKIRDKYFK